MKWISVKEKLPTKNGKYLCYSEYGFVEIFNFSKNLYAVDAVDFPKNEYKGKCGWYAYVSECRYYEIENVTHWMPLPEPPKAELSEEEKAKQALISCGILDKDGNIVDAYKYILIRKTDWK